MPEIASPNSNTTRDGTVFDGRTDSRNKITIYDPKADGTYLGRISDRGWPSASRNA
jgi:hypothetical protein